MIPDYRGLLDLARRSGDVKWADARVVYEGDHFKVQYGSDPRIDHIPNFETQDPSKIIAAYVVGHMDGGGVKFEVVPKWELEKILKTSRAKDDGPPKEWYEEWCKKTAVKRFCKLVGQSPDLAAAIEADNRAESGELGYITHHDTERGVREIMQRATEESAAELQERVIAASKKETPEEDEGEHLVILDVEERIRQEDAAATEGDA